MTRAFRYPPTRKTRETLAQAFSSLVDRRYTLIATSVLHGLTPAPGSRLDRVLKAIEAEANEAAQRGQRIAPGETLQRELLVALDEHLRAVRTFAAPAARRLADEGMRAGSMLARRLTLGTTDAGVLPGWSVPSITALQRMADYSASPAWQAWLNNYPADMVRRARERLLLDYVLGKGPVESARHIREWVTDVPRSALNSKLRTLQLTSLRDATAAEYALNSRLLTGHIRIATFDRRVCPACLALHGTRLRPGERVDDHEQGRCTSVGELIGRPRNIESGEAWLQRQPAATQRDVLGVNNAAAWRRGEIQLLDYVAARQSAVFGRQIIAVNPRRR